MTSVLVTGAGGFIGRRVVFAADNAGYGVTAMVRGPQFGDARSMIQHDLTLPLETLPQPIGFFIRLGHMLMPVTRSYDVQI